MHPEAKKALDDLEKRAGVSIESYRDAEFAAPLVEAASMGARLPLLTVKNWLLFATPPLALHLSLLVAEPLTGALCLLGLSFGFPSTAMIVATSTVRQLLNIASEAVEEVGQSAVSVVEAVMRDIKEQRGAQIPVSQVSRAVTYGVVFPVVEQNIRNRVPMVGGFFATRVSNLASARLVQLSEDQWNKRQQQEAEKLLEEGDPPSSKPATPRDKNDSTSDEGPSATVEESEANLQLDGDELKQEDKESVLQLVSQTANTLNGTVMRWANRVWLLSAVPYILYTGSLGLFTLIVLGIFR